MEQQYIVKGEEESMDLYDFLVERKFRTMPFHMRKIEPSQYGQSWGRVANGIYDNSSADTARQGLATLTTEDSETLNHEPVHTITIHHERKGSGRLVETLNEFLKLRAEFLQMVPNH